MGWLNAIPSTTAETGKGQKTIRWPHPRIKQLQIDKQFEPAVLEYPDAAEYLVSAFIDAGLFSFIGTGDRIPLTWETLRAYSEATGELSEAWQYKALRRMSQKYLDGLQDGQEVLSIPPWDRVSNG